MRRTESHTKTIVTMGPACAPKEVLRQLFQVGVDVCRLNLSHGSHEDHAKVIQTIHELNAEMGTRIAILADLQGPKLRIGEVENNRIELKDGETIKVVNYKCTGTSEQLYINYEKLPLEIKPGEQILLDDGKIRLEAVSSNGKDTIITKIVNGGILSSKKGFNLPDTKISVPAMTEKDIIDAHFAMDHDVDWIALSFVRTAEDIKDLRKMIKERKKHAWIVAKIEKPEAVTNMDSILDATDAVMVARGDLGVEVAFEKVPFIQKEIVKKCIEKAKPVIIATQMLESMITTFRPTRAEATDVANAVLDGADACMLSGETSVGAFPVEALRSMQRIIDWTEDHGYNYNRWHKPASGKNSFFADSICYSAAVLAEQSKARAIITFTNSGYTAFRIASFRPDSEIFVFTGNKHLLNKLSLMWGVRAFFIDKYEDIDDAIEHSIRFLKDKALLDEGDIIINVGSMPLHKRGTTNMLKLSYV